MDEFAEPITLKEWAIIIASSPLILLFVVIPALIVLTFRAICGKEWPWVKP